MKNRKKIIKDFKSVKFMRDVRDKISNDIKDMSYEELSKYFNEKKPKPAATNSNALKPPVH